MSQIVMIIGVWKEKVIIELSLRMETNRACTQERQMMLVHYSFDLGKKNVQVVVIVVGTTILKFYVRKEGCLFLRLQKEGIMSSWTSQLVHPFRIKS